MRPERTPRRPASLAWRVTAFVGLATTLVFVVFGWMVVRSLDRHFAEQDAAELAVVASSVRRILEESPARSGLNLSERLASAVVGHHGVYFQLNEAAGRLLYASHGPDLSALAGATPPVDRVAADGLRLWRHQDQSYHGVVLRLETASGSYTLLAASNMDFHLDYVARFQRSLWLATLLVCAIALLAAWLAVRQGHAALRRIGAIMRGISSDHLHVRLMPTDVPIELAELVESFNAMLARIEASFQQLSHFSADIAHELRTPVTNLTTETQVALSQARGIEEYREILYSNLEEFERMSRMIGDMLFLAQSDNALLRLEMVEVDLAAETRGLFDYFEAWAEDRGVSLRLDGATPPVRGDALMLRRALSNLLSNAIRYTPRGQTVTVRLSERNSVAVVNVENPGPPIAAEHLSHLFDRFYRVDPARQRNGDGAGLGLAIVKSIAQAHGGAVQAHSDAVLTCFELTLPRARSS